MRFLHLSDLHLGKRVNEFSMLEDQAYILKEILNIIDAQKVEAPSRRSLSGNHPEASPPLRTDSPCRKCRPRSEPLPPSAHR